MINHINLRYPIGIDIGRGELHAVQLKQTAKGFAVRGLFHLKLSGEPDSNPEEGENLVSALKSLLRVRRFKGKKAVVHIPSRHTLTFPIRIQVGKAETLEEAILRESVKHLTFPIEKAIFDYPSITPASAEDDNAFDAIVIAVNRDVISEYLSWMGRAGFIVEAFDCGVSSLIRLHHHFYDPSPNPVILCHAGNDESLITVIMKDRILAQRSIPWCMDTLSERIAANLSLKDRDKTLFILKEHGLAYTQDRESGDLAAEAKKDQELVKMNRAIYQIITPYIDELIHEFLKMISYIRMGGAIAAPESIYLYGLTALIRRLDRYIENRINIPVAVVNPLTKVALSQGVLLDDLSKGAPFALTLGLAMRKIPWL